MKIGLCGTMSVGKTTLVNALKELDQFKDYKFATERSKYLNDLGIPLNTDSTMKGQTIFLAERCAELINEDIITDRTILDVMAFTMNAASTGFKEFMDEEERLRMVEALKPVDFALISVDEDRTQCQTLKEVWAMFGRAFNIIFANGGDQTNTSIPEAETCEFLNIKLVDGLGKKVQSSSWLLKKL